MVAERRHLIFATDEQLVLLSRARQWFVDGTFYVVNPPFTQLFTVHAFVKKDGEIKQVPLVYVLMSGKKRRDYKKVRLKSNAAKSLYLFRYGCHCKSFVNLGQTVLEIFESLTLLWTILPLCDDWRTPASLLSFVVVRVGGRLLHTSNCIKSAPPTGGLLV